MPNQAGDPDRAAIDRKPGEARNSGGPKGQPKRLASALRNTGFDFAHIVWQLEVGSRPIKAGIDAVAGPASEVIADELGEGTEPAAPSLDGPLRFPRPLSPPFPAASEPRDARVGRVVQPGKHQRTFSTIIYRKSCRACRSGKWKPQSTAFPRFGDLPYQPGSDHGAGYLSYGANLPAKQRGELLSNPVFMDILQSLPSTCTVATISEIDSRFRSGFGLIPGIRRERAFRFRHEAADGAVHGTRQSGRVEPEGSGDLHARSSRRTTGGKPPATLMMRSPL